MILSKDGCRNSGLGKERMLRCSTIETSASSTVTQVCMTLRSCFDENKESRPLYSSSVKSVDGSRKAVLLAKASLPSPEQIPEKGSQLTITSSCSYT